MTSPENKKTPVFQVRFSAPYIQGFHKKKNIRYANKKIFFRPDYTVGAGISPVQFELPAIKEPG